MTLRSIAIPALTFALAAGSPLAGSAADNMAGMKMSPPKHQCRDKKGHFVKGKYAKCPAGTHKA
jgi:hypothetical protein